MVYIYILDVQCVLSPLCVCNDELEDDQLENDKVVVSEYIY
jgi:hypothetical protein